MKAVCVTKYGPPENLSLRDLPVPKPAKGEILVKVRATTVNRTDCGALLGEPKIVRLFTGLLRPSKSITGTDFAGEVVSTGPAARKFNVGEKVWGFDADGLRSQAEFLVINESKAIERIPAGLTFEEAAACPEGAHYAFNFINKVPLMKGDKVLVIGATGAIGSAMMQLLRYYGAEVDAVCRGKDFELVRALGAKRMFDYTTEDYSHSGLLYDYVFDAAGKSKFGKAKKVLSAVGVYISSEPGPNWENMYLPLFKKLSKGRRVIFPFPSDIKRSMKLLKKMCEEGKFRPVIDRTYPLDQIREAFDYVLSGQKVGNVVVGDFI